MPESGSAAGAHGSVPYASAQDTLRTFTEVVLPLLGRGIIARRPHAEALAERLDADRRAVRWMQQLRERYGPGPLLLRLPVRSLAFILSAGDVPRVLDNSPEPFALANLEKVAALSHFQPHGVLVSHGPLREKRREFNEAVLDSDRSVHQLADQLVGKVHEEADVVLAGAERSQVLSWNDFTLGWWRMVRRVVLGDAAREDHELTDMLARLRSDANWAYLRPKRAGVRSLRAAPARARRSGRVGQPGVTHRGHAGLTGRRGVPANPRVAVRLRRRGDGRLPGPGSAQRPPRAPPAGAGGDGRARPVRPQDLPYLRACVLEAIRLWPTTPIVLRETTTETVWETGFLPAGTGIAIHASFFHRDETRLPHADSLAPDLWLDGRSPDDWPLIPFSGGPGECPGRSIALLLTSSLLAMLLERHEMRLRTPARLHPSRPLPRTLSPFSLKFSVRPR